MAKYDISRLNECLKNHFIYDYYLAIFGPCSIVLVAYVLRELFHYWNPYITPTGIDGITYFGLQTITLLLILSYFSVIFLRIIEFTRRYLRIPWDLVTPPFNTSIESSPKKVDGKIIKRAQILSIFGIGSGAYFAFLFPIFAFVPWRHGTAQISIYRDVAPSIIIPDIIHQVPILNDLTILSQFIASPDAFGYLLLSIIMAPMIVGFWNLTYLFLHHDCVLNNSKYIYSWFNTLLRIMPPVGLFISIVVIVRFGIGYIL